MSTLYQLSEPPDGDHDRAGEVNAFAWTWCALVRAVMRRRVIYVLSDVSRHRSSSHYGSTAGQD